MNKPLDQTVKHSTVNKPNGVASLEAIRLKSFIKQKFTTGVCLWCGLKMGEDLNPKFPIYDTNTNPNCSPNPNPNPNPNLTHNS